MLFIAVRRLLLLLKLLFVVIDCCKGVGNMTGVILRVVAEPTRLLFAEGLFVALCVLRPGLLLLIVIVVLFREL